MHVALLTDGLFPWVAGGIQKHSANLTREWARLGANLDLYFADAGEYPPDDALRAALVDPDAAGQVRFNRFTPKRTPYFPLHHYWECYRDSVQADRLLDGTPAKADFIYVQAYQGLELFRRKRAGKRYPPIGVNLHGVHAWQDLWFSAQEVCLKLVGRPMERFMLRNCDVALSLGGRIDDIIRRVAPRTPIVRSANGISTHWLRGEVTAVHHPLRLVFVGRNERGKGLHILCQALSDMGTPGTVELHVVSPISKRDQLNAPWITYHGGINDEKRMRSLLAQMDVLVNPSLTEGVPTVVLEGMASGLAIIATDVGATRDLVSVENGWLVQANSRHALRQALEQLARETPEGLQRRKAASLKKARAFLWPAIAADTLGAIELFAREWAARN